MIILVWLIGVYIYDFTPTYKAMNIAFLIFTPLLLLVHWFNYLILDWTGKVGGYLYTVGNVTEDIVGNRPFMKAMPDWQWLLIVIVLSYGIMIGMTYVVRKTKKL